MKTMTIKEFIRKSLKENKLPFLGTVSQEETEYYPECVLDDHFQRLLANYVKDNWGKFGLSEDIVEEWDEIIARNFDDLLDLVRDVCQTLYQSNKYRYDTLFETMGYEYDPIENYSMVETETINGENKLGAQSNTRGIGSQQNTNLYGQVQVTDINGAKSETTQHGAQSITHTMGATDETVSNGAQKKTTNNGSTSHTENGAETHGVGAYDTNVTIEPVGNHGAGTVGNTNYNVKDRTLTEKTVADTLNTVVEDIDAHTVRTQGQQVINTDGTAQYSDLFTTQQVTDTHTTAQRTDTLTSGARSDTENLGAREDTNKVQRSLTRKGNIGVTTSQMMIMSQRDVAQFDFVKVVAKDIVKRIACLVY